MFYAEDRAALIRIEKKLDQLLLWLKAEREREMAREQELLDAISAETDAGHAMAQVLDSIAKDLRDLKAGLDPEAQAKIDEAINRIDANKQEWIAKTMENTPADPNANPPA